MAKFIKGDKDINRFKNALCKEIIRILLFFQKTKNEDKEIFMNYHNSSCDFSKQIIQIILFSIINMRNCYNSKKIR
jgi:hypothetical protein